MTALFADLVDYVRMLAEQDAEEVKRRVDQALAAMDAAVVRFGGSREKFIGDAIFAVFGYPVAHDDDALRAGLCALAIRAALADLDRRSAEPLAVRIGIATGEVVAAPRDGRGVVEASLTGPAVAIAARIQALAGASEILVDEATLRAARGRLLAQDRGSRRLRGHPGPVRLHALRSDLGLGPGRMAAGRLVGRQEERARLRRLLDACRRTGLGQVGVVAGEAGMGKSRLLADLEADARAAGFHWTWTENVSYATGEPFRFIRAFAQTIADEHGIDSGSFARQLMFTDNVDTATVSRIGGAIAALAREAAFSGWEAEAPLAPTDPAEVMAAILDLGRRYTVRLAEADGPRVVVVDDLHWADRSSAPILEQLAELAPSLPMVLLFGSRPGLPRWLERGGVERIVLTGLDPAQTSELAADVAGSALPAEGARIIHERTAGNPLFVGETVRALLDDGHLALRAGHLELVGSPSDGAMPVTLRALLGARIDGLAATPREALGIGAVIGIVFDGRLVSELAGRRLDRRVFERLADAAMIAPVDGRQTWRFSHPLIRDAAYAGLLAARRRDLHTRLADRLEASPAAGIGRAARHRVAAGDAERALPLLEAAAREALAVGAKEEAAGFWRTAAGLVSRDDPRAATFLRAAEETIAGTVGVAP